MRKKLVVISIDALGAADLAGDVSHLPNIKSLIASGTHVEEVTGIYPTVTYPSHTTIVTGCYPKTHGIVNNVKRQSNKLSPDWYWYAKDIRVPTLFDAAHEEGLKTAAFLWPVTARSTIDYNIAEIFPNRIWTNQVLISLHASSPLFLFQMNRKYGHLRKGIKQPELDDFITACAVDTLKNKRPDVTLIHLVDMDSQRHGYGVNSHEAEAALLRQDRRVGEIIQAVAEAGDKEETVFAILGDHYQIDVDKMIRLNVLFAEKGWQVPTKIGTTKPNWEVWANSCDGSTYIYIKKESAVSPSEVRELIEKAEGIEVVYTTDQAKSRGADPKCTFMVEAKRGYYFVDEAKGASVAEVQEKEMWLPWRYRAVHGFSPEKENYATTLVLSGPGIRKNHKKSKGRLIDEAPTFAKILGLNTFPQKIDGKVLEDVFEE
ncbi:alkaline phosphatase family protein [Vagococcus elongatus]|uniref:Alkaline phosphatase family protein n=1 Tax=Vagococcus elongatus TaxID=180344 RepID=A0A430AHR3_9ENTE|nr:alkaline phosphatase family protein [Vagococcus elongatus]